MVAELRLLSAVGDHDGIHLSFSRTAALTNLLATSPDSLWLSFGDAPNAYWGEVNADSDHGGFVLPRSNLSAMQYQLNRSCSDATH